MAFAKYTRLATDDAEDEVRFDFSSAFTFEERGKQLENYKSVFTYGMKDDLQTSKTGRHDVELQRGSSDRFAWLLVYFGYMVIFVMTFPIAVWFSFKRVKEGERMVVFRLGHMQKAKGPGLALVLPFLDRYHKKDVSLRAFSVPPKQIITGDKAIIEVGAEIYFQIVDVEKSVTNVQDLDRSTRVLLQTALCNLLAQRNLADIQTERRVVADRLMEKSNATCTAWGVEITRAELSQIKVLSKPLPKQAPSVMMPPGLFGMFGGGASADSSGNCASTSGAEGDKEEGAGSTTGLPAALAQLASSLTGDASEQTEAITQALQAIVGPNIASPQQSETEVTALTDAGTGDSAAEDKPGESCATTTDKTTEGEMSPDQILTMIRAALCEEVVTKIQATYQFDISGEGAGSYFLNLRDGEGSLTEGPDPDGTPSATLTLTFADLQAMLGGTLKAYQAYLMGRLRVAGDIAAALRLDIMGSKIRQQHKEKETAKVETEL